MFPLSPSLADERATDFADFLCGATEDQLYAELEDARDNDRHGDVWAIREILWDRFPSPE